METVAVYKEGMNKRENFLCKIKHQSYKDKICLKEQLLKGMVDHVMKDTKEISQSKTSWYLEKKKKIRRQEYSSIDRCFNSSGFNLIGHSNII